MRYRSATISPGTNRASSIESYEVELRDEIELRDDVELRDEEPRAEYARVGGSSDFASFAALLLWSAESIIRVGASLDSDCSS